MNNIVVREFARLSTRDIENQTLDLAQISSKAFDWLCELQNKWKKSEYAFIEIDGAKTLNLNNYVGLLSSPCGTHIEVLPKTHFYGQDIIETREILWKMICVYMGKDIKESDKTSLKCSKKPLNEWLIYSFLQELVALLRSGLHSQYHKVEEERNFIRGQINLPRQMRQPLHKQHKTHVRHNIFLLDSPENRLIKTALYQCRLATRDKENWMLATNLETTLQQIPFSNNIINDFRQWLTVRHKKQYLPIKPWCSLVLNEQLPIALEGAFQGISLLFPMEKLFEAFVTHSIKSLLPKEITLKSQTSEKYLCIHKAKNIFNLKPDILLESEQKKSILDAKWKLLDPNKNNYGISQTDMYQLFAYGQKYMDGKGELVLVYPQTDTFHGIEEPFYFSENMKLFIMAINLKTGELLSRTRFYMF